MMGMIFFFSAIILLEILLLFALVQAYIWIHRGHVVLRTARAQILVFKTSLSRNISVFEKVSQSVSLWSHAVALLMPWWLRALLTAGRWVLKLRT